MFLIMTTYFLCDVCHVGSIFVRYVGYQWLKKHQYYNYSLPNIVCYIMKSKLLSTIIDLQRHVWPSRALEWFGTNKGHDSDVAKCVSKQILW